MSESPGESTGTRPARRARWSRLRSIAPGVVVAVLLFWPLLSRSGFDSADHLDFYLRTVEYSTEVGAGHWPQLLPGTVGGGGHAFPRFYPPLAHLAAAGFGAVTADPVLASHLAVLLAVVLSAAGVSLLVLELGGSWVGAMVAGICYAALPYRGLQLLVRGAFAEAWLLALLPLVLLGLVRWSRVGRLPTWWPLAVAAAMLAHTATGLWALPLLGGVTLLANRPRGLRPWGELGLHLLLAAGIASAFLLPAAWYLPGVRAGDPALMHASAAAVAGGAGAWSQRLLTVLLAFILSALGVVQLVEGGRTREPERRWAGASLLGAGMLLGVTVAPDWFWSLVPQPWRYIQFPWRLVGPVTFLLSVGVGLTVPRFRSRLGKVALGLALAAIASGSFVEFRRQAVTRPGLTAPAILDSIGAPYSDLGLTLGGDYLPIEADPATLGRRIAETRDSLIGTGALTDQPRDGSFVLELQATSGPQEIPLPLVAYDTWRLRDQDGRDLLLRSDRGQWVARAPAGTRSVRAERRLPPVVLLGMGLSLVSLLGVGWSGVRRRGG